MRNFPTSPSSSRDLGTVKEVSFGSQEYTGQFKVYLLFMETTYVLSYNNLYMEPTK